MINEEKLLKNFFTLHSSEKSSFTARKNNTIVLKFSKNISKKLIFNTIKKLFKIEIEKIRTTIVKGKKKRHGKNIGYRSNWKKVYVKLKKGQNLDIS